MSAKEVDWRSHQLGAIAAFAEVVDNGCKRLALSSPMTGEQFDSVIDDIREIAAKRDLILHVDDDFLVYRIEGRKRFFVLPRR